MTSRLILVLSRRSAGVQVAPPIAGSDSSSITLRIRFSASDTASSTGPSRKEGETEVFPGVQQHRKLTYQFMWSSFTFRFQLLGERFLHFLQLQGLLQRVLDHNVLKMKIGRVKLTASFFLSSSLSNATWAPSSLWTDGWGKKGEGGERGGKEGE